MGDARFAHSGRPFHHDGFSTCAARRATRRGRRIRSDQISDVDPEPFASPCAQSAHSGSVSRGIVFPLDQTESAKLPDSAGAAPINLASYGLAEALSRVVSDADCLMILRIRQGHMEFLNGARLRSVPTSENTVSPSASLHCPSVVVPVSRQI